MLTLSNEATLGISPGCQQFPFISLLLINSDKNDNPAIFSGGYLTHYENTLR